MYDDDLVEQFLRESNAIEDVWDHESLVKARRAWDYLTTQKRLSTFVVQKTHEILMEGKLAEEELGHWRRIGVKIGGRFGAHPIEIDDMMARWCVVSNWMLDAPLTMREMAEEIRLLHVRYEKIHPFVDGNGRTGRLFLNWMRLQAGLPIMVILESEKRTYYKWFTES